MGGDGILACASEAFQAGVCDEARTQTRREDRREAGREEKNRGQCRASEVRMKALEDYL